jgi:non-specific serine/threonine protein kinase
MSRRALVAIVAAVLAAASGAALLVADGNGDDHGAQAGASGRWTALQPALLSRTEVAAARVGRFIYVVGGFEQRSGGTTAAVERYDIRRDRWRRVRSMPVGLNHPAAAAYRGAVYVLGGYTGRGDLRGEVASLYRYDPRRDRWARLPDAPTKRAALAVGVIGGKLYAAGGANAGGALATLEIYDFARRRWARGPDMGKAREHLAGAVVGGAFYVLAGRVSGQGNFKVAERYLPRSRRWEKLPDMRKPRGGIAATAVGRRVVVAGGEEATGTIGEVEAYDPAARSWSSLPGMRTPRHGLGLVSRGRRVYAIEGGPTPGFDFANTIEALDVRG